MPPELRVSTFVAVEAYQVDGGEGPLPTFRGRNATRLQTQFDIS